MLDYYPLDSISESFPEDVDARISSMVTCPSQVHIAWCQWVRAKSTTKALRRHTPRTQSSKLTELWLCVCSPSLSLSCSVSFLRATGLWQLYGFSSHNPDQMLELLANSPGLTSLMLASLIGHLTAARRLLERGASLSLTNCYGRTPLMLAAMAGQEELVALLLSVGAAPDGVDSWGRDASEWARQRGHHHIVRLIQAAKRERKQWMISQMRGLPPGSIAGRFGLGAGGDGSFSPGREAAFDPVAERREKGELQRLQTQAEKQQVQAAQATLRAEAKAALRGGNGGGRSMFSLSARRGKSAPAASSATSSATSTSSGASKGAAGGGGASKGSGLSSMRAAGAAIGLLSGPRGRSGGAAGAGGKRGTPGYATPKQRGGGKLAGILSGRNKTGTARGEGGAGGGGGWASKWLFSSRVPAEDSELLAPPHVASSSNVRTGHVEGGGKQRPANEEEEGIALVDDHALTHAHVDPSWVDKDYDHLPGNGAIAGARRTRKRRTESRRKEKEEAPPPRQHVAGSEASRQVASPPPAHSSV